MAKTTLTITTPDGVDPFAHNTTRPKKAIVRELIGRLEALIGGGMIRRAVSRPTVAVGTAYATATVTAATVVNANTVTINGTAMTATAHNSIGTVTCVSSIADDTVTVDAVTFTAVTGAVVLGSAEFSIDTSDTAAATSLAAQINAHQELQEVVTAKSAAGVVTVRAYTGGTAGDAIVLVSSDGDTLAVSPGATLGSGATVANNQFDFTGTDAETATALSACIAASSTSLISGQCKGSSYAGVITLTSVAMGDSVTIDGVRLIGVNGTATNINEWKCNDTDTNDATSLKNVINAHPRLKDKVFASSSTTAVTIRHLQEPAVSPGYRMGYSVTSSAAAIALTGLKNGHTTISTICLVSSIEKGLSGNTHTLASSGSTLAVSAARLAGGTSTTYTL